MSNQQTLTKMKAMRLLGMHHAFAGCLEKGRTDQFTPDELTGFLIDHEWDDRHNRSIERSLKNARFRYSAMIENIDYSEHRGLDKNQIHRLAEGVFISRKESLIITGPTGTGKSYLASALGHQACQLGFKVLYSNTLRLFNQIKMAKADGSSIRELAKIEKQDLLILDDFGIQPFDTHTRLTLLEIIEDRHGKRSTIFASQLPVRQWYEVIGEKTVADAILDRIVHDAHRVELKGESLRKTKGKIAKDNELE
ncbi:MAG TPA: IS21-like element helper ATPase IstB [Saprospiraceae bacterium]|jgi:DNA replication protein DnaC